MAQLYPIAIKGRELHYLGGEGGSWRFKECICISKPFFLMKHCGYPLSIGVGEIITLYHELPCSHGHVKEGIRLHRELPFSHGNVALALLQALI